MKRDLLSLADLGAPGSLVWDAVPARPHTATAAFVRAAAERAIPA